MAARCWAFVGKNAKRLGAVARKAYSMASDPVVQARTKRLVEAYQAATSPEAKQAYGQAAGLDTKARRE
jgi:hypothetical protein